MAESAPAAAPAVAPAPNAQQPGGKPAVTPQSRPGGQPPPGDAPPPAPEPPRRHKLVIGGREEEYDEPRVLAMAQKGEHASRKYQEAAQMQREAEALKARLKTDAWGVLRDAGLSDEQIQEIAERRVLDAIQRQQMSPEQRAIQERDAKIAAYEAKEREAAETAEQTRSRQEAQHYQAEYAKTFTTALQKMGIGAEVEDPFSDPLTGHALAKMAMLEQENARGDFGLSPDELAEVVGADLDKGAALRLRGLEGNGLLERLEAWEPGLVKRIAAATVDRYQLQSRAATAPRGGNGQFRSNAPKQEVPVTLSVGERRAQLKAETEALQQRWSGQ